MEVSMLKVEEHHVQPHPTDSPFHLENDSDEDNDNNPLIVVDTYIFPSTKCHWIRLFYGDPIKYFTL